jgi:hypothetical protein
MARPSALDGPWTSIPIIEAMSSAETPTPVRDDFFTLIHKGLRQALFSSTTRAGTLDWDDRAAVDGFAAQWSELHHLLQILASHEDEHFFPLLDERAPEIVAGVHAEHHDETNPAPKGAASAGRCCM